MTTKSLVATFDRIGAGEMLSAGLVALGLIIALLI